MIVVDAKIVRDLVDQRCRDLFAQLGARQAELEVRLPEQVNDVRQLAGIAELSIARVGA